MLPTRKYREIVCRICMYPHSGLSAGSVCPECGSSTWVTSPYTLRHAIHLVAVATIDLLIAATGIIAAHIIEKPPVHLLIVLAIFIVPRVPLAVAVLLCYRGQLLLLVGILVLSVTSVILSVFGVVLYWKIGATVNDYAWPVTNVAIYAGVCGGVFVALLLAASVYRVSVRAEDRAHVSSTGGSEYQNPITSPKSAFKPVGVKNPITSPEPAITPPSGSDDEGLRPSAPR